MKILHPTDFSQTAEKAYILAKDLSDRFGSSLDTVFVQQRYEALPSSPKSSQTALHIDYAKRLDEARAFETEHYRSRLAYFTGEHSEGHLLWGEPVTKLLEFSHGYDLIVMGAHGANRLDNFFLGGVAGRLVRRSNIPILTVRDEAQSNQIKRLLVATDFSEAAKHAWSWVQPLAEKGIELNTVHIIDEKDLQQEPGYVKAVTEALELYSGGKANHEWVRNGSVVTELPAIAQEIGADAIVLGLSQHKNALGLMLGSEADRLLRSSPVPILSVPYTEEIKD
jgi:nucleotide-binding universal stress UspA family protein